MLSRAQLIDYFIRRDRGWVLGMFAAACVVYLPFLGNHFFFDDQNLFSTAAIEAYGNTRFGFSLRWLPYALLGRMNAIFSVEFPHVYRLAGLLLHTATAVLLFYLLRRLSHATQPQSQESPEAIRGAWFGALIFAIHPVAAFAAGYAIQISIVMATMFSLAMLLAYLRGVQSGQHRWLALAVVAYFLACFSKEHSVLMPAVAAAMSLLVRDRRASWRALVLAWLAFLAIAMLVTLRARGVFGSPYEEMAARLFTQQGIEASTPTLHLLSAMTQAGLFFKYLLLWVLPDPALMSIDMREFFVASISAWQGWLGAAAFLLYGVLGIRLLLRGGASGLAGFALLYPWLLFWVEMVGIRVQEPFVLYRSYLWLPGLLLLTPLLLAKLPQRRVLPVMVCVTLVLIALSWGRLRVFSDNFLMWNEAASLLKSEATPGADRIFYNRGLAEMDAEKWEEAAVDFRRSLAISPQLGPIHYWLGVAYANSGRHLDALAEFDTAIALDPNSAPPYYSKAMTLMNMHRSKEAMPLMEKSCKLNDRTACLILSLAGKKHD